MAKRKASDASTSNIDKDELIYERNDNNSAADPLNEDPTLGKMITKANQLKHNEFCDKYIDTTKLVFDSDQKPDEALFRITVRLPEDMPDKEYDQCFDLIESTSRPDYESSSMGWHPRRKRREMREDEMRYLLLSRNGPDDRFEGFMSFMLTHDSTPSVPVLYIYEVHLESSIRKLGIGKHLMDLAESTARRVGVVKIMLTCFLINEKAHQFYVRNGFSTDECSPQDRTTRKKTLKPDYVILSKRLRPNPKNVD